MKRALRTAVLAGVVTAVTALLLPGCGGGTQGDALVARGEELFGTHCAACHGPQATGTGFGPPLVHIVYEPGHHSDEAFHRAVAQGVQPHHWEFGPMPPVPAVDEDEIEAIIAYVRALQRDAGIE